MQTDFNLDEILKSNADQVLGLLLASTNGLNTDDVKQRQEQYGPNVLEKAHQTPLIMSFLQNFISMMAILLWIAGGIAFIAGLTELGIAIWLVNLINGVFSFWQEFQAGKATAALNKLMTTETLVLRNGQQKMIPTDQLVPGDIVILNEGDRVPADIRLLDASGMRVDQSTLTGEANPVSKNTAIATDISNHAAVHNMVYMGTSLMQGHGRGVVVTTGMNTEFGKITRLTQTVHEKLSPLQKELNILTKQLSLLAVGIGIIFFFCAVFFVHYPVVASFIFALGMIVAFIPEGLLPTVTLSLAGAVSNMAREHALIKKLASVETLGSATVICSDKTGTLTQNAMTVAHLWTSVDSYHVTGEGYQPNGNIFKGGTALKGSDEPVLRELLLGGLLTDNAMIKENADHTFQIIGDPTEACLEVVVQKGGLNVKALRQSHQKVDELPFNSNRKMMTVKVQANQSEAFNVYSKGAPNKVLDHCTTYLTTDKQIKPLTDNIRRKIMAANDGYAAQALRVLAVAGRQLDDTDDFKTAEQNMTFIGLSAMFDPPRNQVIEAIADCHRAHIKIIMITGDNGITAESIARKIGIVSHNDQMRVVTGGELTNLSDEALKDALKGDVLFARMASEQKYRIIACLQDMGHVVAVTGDGVNDAPALKRADIGIAMGRSGTDVAKEAADVILTDDNFASIVAAIKAGRGVYSNIRKFLLYILSSNVPEAFPSILFLLSGGKIPLALTVMQILLIDLGTDMIPALGLGREPTEPTVMSQPPRKKAEHLITKNTILKAFAWYGALSSILSASAFFFSNYLNGHSLNALVATGFDYRQATTLTLGTIIFCQMAVVLNCRYDLNSLFYPHHNFWSNGLVYAGIVFEALLFIAVCYVPLLQSVFGTTPLILRDWLYLILLPMPLILLNELRKYFLRKKQVA